MLSWSMTLPVGRGWVTDIFLHGMQTAEKGD
jgi:hypothetical protein